MPSGPTFDHLERLRAAGMSVKDIAHAADLPRTTVYALTKAGARERKQSVSVDTAAHILAVGTAGAPAATTAGAFVMTFPFYGGPAWTEQRAQRAALQYVLEEAAQQDVVLDAEQVTFVWLASRGRRFLVVRAPGSTTTPRAEVVRAAEHLAYAHRAVLPGLAAWIDGHLQQEAAA